MLDFVVVCPHRAHHVFSSDRHASTSVSHRNFHLIPAVFHVVPVHVVPVRQSVKTTRSYPPAAAVAGESNPLPAASYQR